MRRMWTISERPTTTLKTGAVFSSDDGTEWTIIVSAGDGTAAVESEEEAGEYSDGIVYLCNEEDTYGANGVPEYIVKNGSWYNNAALNKSKDRITIRKNNAFRKLVKKK